MSVAQAVLGTLGILGYTVLCGIATRVFKLWMDDEDARVAGLFWPIVGSVMIGAAIVRGAYALGLMLPTLMRRRTVGLAGCRVVRWGEDQ